MSEHAAAAPTADLLQGVKLKHAETVDKSKPIVKGEADDQAEKVVDVGK